MAEQTPFSDNLRRVIGLHGLGARQTARLLQSDPATFSQWLNNRRRPSLNMALRLSELFEISPDRLVSAPFEELIERELADVERFRRVEERIRRGSTKLASVS